VADIVLDEQGTPSAPSSGQMILYPDNAASMFLQMNDAGTVQGDLSRASTAQQTGFASDTYITNSGLILPSASMRAGAVFMWEMVITKTAAGAAAPVWQVRIGANQTTSDTSRLSITTATQTAAADTAFVKVMVNCRSVGASGVIQGSVWIQHNLAATGFANTPAGFNLVEGTSAGFDNTALGGQYIGLSVNGGASAAWTINQMLGRYWFG
jgi:hypothetical protein